MIYSSFGSEQNRISTTAIVRIAATRHLNVMLVVVMAQLVDPSAAAPLTSSHGGRMAIWRRDQYTGGGVQYQIWIPIIIIILLLLVTVVAFFYRRRIALQITQSRRAAPGSGSERELTAEQLAGSINAGANPAAGANRTRRTRRPRRTPSQISTTSLPAYAKEPGEEEVVIFRGTDDMEDARMPEAVVMPSLPEDAEESMDSGDQARYTSMPSTPVDMPLLQQDDEHRQRVGDDDAPRQSSDTLNDSEEASSLMRGDPSTPASDDPRGETPGYYEVVELTRSSANQPENTAEPLATLSYPSSASETALPRHTSFRRMLNALPNRLSMASRSHIRVNSAFSMVSSEDSHHSHTREVSRSRISHRPTASGSSSLLNLAPLRTLSRQKSLNNGDLTSPSLISLNSISAPLTHTLTRTDFTYPKSGPTPEQLKLISSRESFGRFGVPYGPDAIAFASSSRQDLSVPPPSFDERPVSAGGSARPSRLRSESSAVDSQREVEDLPSSPPTNIGPEAEPADREPRVPESTSSSSRETGLSSSLTNLDTSPQLQSGRDEGLKSSLPVQSPAEIPLPESPEAPKRQPPPAKLGISIGIEPIIIPKNHTPIMTPPPSSYRYPSMLDRPESRASSVQTFATAPESMGQPGYHSDQEDDEDFEVETPTTPKFGAGLTLEATDATVAQGTAVMH